MDLTHFAKEGVSRSILNNPTFNVGIFLPDSTALLWPYCYEREKYRKFDKLVKPAAALGRIPKNIRPCPLEPSWRSPSVV